MKSPIVRAANRWQNLREKTVFQLTALEREKVIPAEIADHLRATFYETDEALQKTVFAVVGRCK